jgi:hypothetical protein
LFEEGGQRIRTAVLPTGRKARQAVVSAMELNIRSREVGVMGCTRDRNVERGTKGFRVRKTGLSSTLIRLRYEQ